MPGMDNSAFNSTASLQTAENLVYYNNWFFNQNLFEQIGSAQIPAGDNIYVPIEYSTTSYAGTMAAWDPAKTPDTVDGVMAYFNKDAFQGSGLTSDMLQRLEAGYGQMVPPTASLISEEKARTTAAKNLRAAVCSQMISDFEAQIDSAGTFSDASLTRSTYSLASYEDTAGGVISLAQMEDAIEALLGTTYGAMTDVSTEAAIILPQNQLTNLARAGSASEGVSFNETNFMMNASSQDPTPIDAGRVTRTKTFEGIPIYVIPGLTTTNIFIVRKDTIGVYTWWDITEKMFPIQGFQNSMGYAMGAVLIVRNPRFNAKISGLTA